MSVTGSGDHVFGRVRPSHDGDFQVNGTTVRVTIFRDLPAPTGPAPYHLDLANIIPAGAYEEVIAAKKLVFHFNATSGESILRCRRNLSPPGWRPGAQR